MSKVDVDTVDFLARNAAAGGWTVTRMAPNYLAMERGMTRITAHCRNGELSAVRVQAFFRALSTDRVVDWLEGGDV